MKALANAILSAAVIAGAAAIAGLATFLSLSYESDTPGPAARVTDPQTQAPLDETTDQLDRADHETVRLSPEAFPALPSAIAARLRDLECTIPQAWGEAGRHNVIAGRFIASQNSDWAVLCSRQRASSILVFPAGAVDSMIELAARILIDRGMSRGRALVLIAVVALVFGLPSALSTTILDNQDTVWGIGLMLSGLFFGFAVLKYGVDRFRHEHVNSAGSDFTIGRWWSVAMILVVLEALVLLVWWFSQSLSAEGLAASVNPFRSFSLGTIVLQWAVLLAICLGLNRWLGRMRPGAGAAGEAA